MPNLSLDRARRFFRRGSGAESGDASPLRCELLSVEQLERHARALGTSHRTTERPRPSVLLENLDRNEVGLRDFNRATLKIVSGRRLTPAAEWVLDNFYLVEEQVALARRHLPKGYNRELPSLLESPTVGLPRVYDLVLDYLSHVDAQVEVAPLHAFMRCYQQGSTLKLGELWAVPIMLRLGLIENLHRVTRRLTVARRDADLADRWIDRLQAVAEKSPSRLVIEVSDMARADLPVSSAFVAEFCQRLALRSPLLHLARSWLEQRLSEEGTTVERLVHLESQQQAAEQVTVSHCIASLRSLGAIDWKEFVEGLSEVELILRTDPGEVYRLMDFATRDRYRHVVEAMARHSALTETEVARVALGLATEATQRLGGEHREAHVGFFLVDRGRPLMARRARVQWPPGTRGRELITRHPLAFHLGGIGLLTTLAMVAACAWARAAGLDNLALGLLALCLLVPVSQGAVALLHVLTTWLVKPTLLPRMDTAKGIAAGSRTIVVVPAMLAHADGVDGLLETIELHFLSNRDPNLHFALLTDFLDSPTPERSGDEALLARAQAGVAALNAKYPEQSGSGFFLFHRPRRWNGVERLWMGYERKRGKLADLNGWLRGGSKDCFTSVVGEVAMLGTVKYVITLDTDTQLPRDAARQLVGTMDHRLNRPVFDATRGVVVEGYGILQPRASVSLPSARKSRFARLFAGEVGIDPYTREVSDGYQDLFQEGSFIGKGIYDVDTFARATAERFPETTVLSHDLLEGCLARSGLVSDVELYEAHPSRYEVDTTRRHRWIRGDWQIVPWLGRRVRAADGSRRRNPLSWLSQWKIFDNLRRSAVPVATLLFLLGAWLLAPAGGVVATLLVLALLAIPAVFGLLAEGPSKPEERPHGMHWRGVFGALGRQGTQVAFGFAMLPQEAWLSANAAGRTLWRLLFSRRRLLEWKTASAAELGQRSGPGRLYRELAAGPVVALVIGGALAGRAPEYLTSALPLLLLWLLGPALAWWIGRPLTEERPTLSGDDAAFLRRCARKTWFFFETFVTARERWLPPDNFQEDPPTGIASRTSPTNLGLALLANLAARDLGYLPESGLVRRTRDALTSMDALERLRGHFYNWYDTRTGQPLLPLYVSSVDSGNLAGHLLTLSPWLALPAQEVPADAWQRLDLPLTLGTLAGRESPVDLGELADDAAGAELARCVREGAAQAGERIAALEELARQCEAFAVMDFTFLFDPQRKLFATGYRVDDRQLDTGFYDLLASEARLGSYVTIALGQVPKDHWFTMGRLLVGPRGEPTLISWSGSMFEYLMPLLVMPTYEGTLLDHTCRLAVQHQIEFGERRGVPWGVSESGYNRTDAHLNFQYRAFGVPGLGLKRGLDEDLVIAPYASALALMVSPVEACANLRRLAAEGREGTYGFYEAIDYTPSRLPPGVTSVLLRSYMVHHQGMSLLAYLDVLEGRPMARRFLVDHLPAHPKARHQGPDHLYRGSGRVSAAA